MRDVDDVQREVPLTGGNTPGVVRAGDTVRRPLNPGSDENAYAQNRRDEFEVTAGGDNLVAPQ